MSMRDINAVKPSCARIDKQIAALEKEKAERTTRGCSPASNPLRLRSPRSISSLAPMAGMSPSRRENGRPPSIASLPS